MTAHISTLALHRLRYGELDPGQAAAIHAHLAGCAACGRRLRDQEQERAAFVTRAVPEAIRRIPREAHRESPLWATELRGLFGALVASAAVFVAVPALRPADDLALAPSSDVVRSRGQLPTIEAWVDRGDGPHLLLPGERLSAGHRVNLAYDPRGASAIAIAGRDSTGAIEVYSTNSPTGVGLVRAPFALTLDDAPGTQELFVVGSQSPLRPDQIELALTEGLPDVWVSRVAIEKDR
jgi:Putative zinc-finger